MSTSHDDLPHRVPPYGHLRYKENWFFVIIAPDQDVFGIAHVNTENVFDRARFSCNLSIEGELYSCSTETAFPSPFPMMAELDGGIIKVCFVEPGRVFELHLDSGEIKADFTFTKRYPTFDYDACRYANPDQLSTQELLTFGTNLPYKHHQQSLTVAGSIHIKDAREPRTLMIAGAAYCDHTWAFRADNMLAWHIWSALIFSDFVIGVKSLGIIARPEVDCREGYIADSSGSTALRHIKITRTGEGPDGLGAKIHYELADMFGRPFTVIADVAGRMGHVSLGTATSFRVVENFCPAVLEQTGEVGITLTEMGISTAAASNRSFESRGER